jgi:NADH-quinone oxidoreductase subunit A
MSDYLPILVMAGLVVAFVLLSFIASQLLAPQRPNAAKQAPYECGIVPEEEPAERFPVKFYLIAMAFIVLDVEIVFLYPFSVVYRGLGFYGLVAVGVFILVLLVPFAYLLSVGALDWAPVRDVVHRMPGQVLRSKEVVLDPAAAQAQTQPAAAQSTREEAA